MEMRNCVVSLGKVETENTEGERTEELLRKGSLVQMSLLESTYERKETILVESMNLTLLSE